MDITKCNGEGCLIKEKCIRYTSKASKKQSYINPPFTIDKGLFTCELFWGEQSELLLEQLKLIMNGSKK